MSRLVIFIFAGRRANMEVQRPMLDRILTKYPESELHLWDLTRDAADQRYLHGLVGAHGGRMQVLSHLHPGHPIRCANPGGRRGRRYPCKCLLHRPPYEKPYQWYAANPLYSNAVFLKMDDDVLFLETERLDDMLSPLADHPNKVISANVVNNAVCAKYEDSLIERMGVMPNPKDPACDAQWWLMHTLPEFARTSHEWFLDAYLPVPEHQPRYVRTRPGEAVSINCIAFTHATMKRLAKSFEHSNKLGDEGTIDSFLPWIARSCHAAHLTFGPQERVMPERELNKFRLRYEYLNYVYLGALV